MTYDPTIPQGEPSPAVQQPEVQTNFSQFASVFSSTSGGVIYNHSALNSANQGKHEAILLQDVVTHPTILNPNGYIALYNVAGQINVRIPVFNRGPPNVPMGLTAPTVNTSGTPNYQSFLAGSYIVYWGKAVKGTPISLSPVPSSLVSVIALPNSGNNLYDIGASISGSTFTLNSVNAPGGYQFSFMAIGLQ
jgi:hypothetical protein